MDLSDEMRMSRERNRETTERLLAKAKRVGIPR